MRMIKHYVNGGDYPQIVLEFNLQAGKVIAEDFIGLLSGLTSLGSKQSGMTRVYGSRSGKWYATISTTYRKPTECRIICQDKMTITSLEFMWAKGLSYSEDMDFQLFLMFYEAYKGLDIGKLYEFIKLKEHYALEGDN